MRKDKVYILHKSGADSHYSGLAYFLKKNNSQLVYREFSVISSLFKGIRKFNFPLIYKQFINFLFLANLIFTKNKKIVLGIAPFDKKLALLLPSLQKHQIYYHTSWASWDGSFVPKNKNISKNLKEKWKNFLQKNVKQVFAVTSTTKNELIKHYQIDEDKISIVNHSFDSKEFLYQPNSNRRHNSFISVGRLTDAKGVTEILSYFQNHEEAFLTVVGSGELEDKVKAISNQCININFLGYIKDKKKLSTLFNEHQYILLNSKRTNKWEELFGMVLIEGMACGLIPAASNHPGPREIIKDSLGFLYDEDKFEEEMNKILSLTYSKSSSEIALEHSRRYSLESISKKWHTILS